MRSNCHTTPLQSLAAYIRDGWNALDFIVVVISVLTYAIATPGSVSSFRALRALRPLRVVRRHPGMKKVVDTMIKTVPPSVNVVMVCGVFFLIFSILGVMFFKGTYYSCGIDAFNSTVQAQIEDEYGLFLGSFKKHFTKQDCLRLDGEWDNASNNFDSVAMGMINLLEMATTEGWVDAMYNGVDSTGVDLQPVRGWNRSYSAFFVLFVIVGNFFVLNLFVGAVIDAFNTLQAGSSTGESFAMTQGQQEWVERQKITVKLYKSLRATRNRTPVKAGKNQRRSLLHCIAVDESFSMFIMVCILLNTLSMASKEYLQDQSWDVMRKQVDYIFAAIFTLEAGIKLGGHKMKYFQEGWNVFDFVIVVGSDTTIVVEWLLGVEIGALAQAARAFRMCRMARLTKGMAAFESMLDLVIRNLPMMSNISAVLLLLLFVYAVMAMQMFGTVLAPQGNLTRHANFQNFLNSYLTLFRCTTGEAWNGIMYDITVSEGCTPMPTYAQLVTARQEANSDWITIGCGGSRGGVIFFFISFVVVASFVMMNLVRPASNKPTTRTK